MNILNGLQTLIKAVSDVLTAGVAIISFSLLVYAITFKLRDRVTNSFTALLLCMVVIYGTDAFLTVTRDADLLRTILKIHWFGIILLPSAYFHFSDALLSFTGKPSRGRRKLVGVLCLAASLIFSSLLFTDLLVGNVIMDQPPAPFFERTIFNDFFSAFFVVVMLMSWYNYIRAYQRTNTQTSRRRMLYLIVSAIGPALGSFPYLLYGLDFAAHWPLVFWLISMLSNAGVFITLITMTYAVSFFGFPWAERVIKTRLFRWVMRGPVTASLTLGVTTIITRLGRQLGVDVSAILVISMVAVIVLFEYSITLFSRIWERVLFLGGDREELEKIRLLEDRLLTSNDIRQFNELLLATLCDLLQVCGACLLLKDGNGAMDQQTGRLKRDYFKEKDAILNFVEQKSPFASDSFLKMKADVQLLPIFFDHESGQRKLLGSIIIEDFDPASLDGEKSTSIEKLVDRLAMALHDRSIQEDLFDSLEILTPQVSVIQTLLATSQFDQKRIYSDDPLILSTGFDKWVKDALDHLWGGPKLSQNPILQLRIVERKVNQNKETPVNALREILRQAIDQLKPEGERQYTNEWILYNLLDLKYQAGWKVKDIARKLALSEADLYRKQRIAIEAVSRRLIEMEKSLPSE